MKNRRSKINIVYENYRVPIGNIIFFYCIFQFFFLVQSFAVFLQHFLRMSGHDLIKTKKNKKKPI